MRQWGLESGAVPGPWLAIAEDSAGRLWVRSGERVLVREPSSREFHPVPGLPVLTSSSGAPLESTRSGRVLIPHNAGLAVCLGGDCRDHGVEDGLRPAEVRTVIEDREGSIWIGYSGHGVARWLGKGQWQSFDMEEGLSNPGCGASSGTARGICGWLPIAGCFVAGRPAGRWRFEHSGAAGQRTVHGLVEDQDGSLLVGTFQAGLNGLLRYYPSTGRKVIYPPSVPLQPFSVSDLVRDEAGTVWVVASGMLMHLKPGAAKLEPDSLQVPAGALVHSVASSNGKLAVGTSQGLTPWSYTRSHEAAFRQSSARLVSIPGTR